MVAHHDNSIYVKKYYGTDYISYIDILCICKQVFNTDLKRFQIKDDKGNRIINDALIVHVFNVYEGVNKIYFYVDVDPTCRTRHRNKPIK